MGAFVNHIGPNNINVTIQLFETLTEFVQGPCRENQALLASSVCEPINSILQHQFTDCHSRQVDELKSSAVLTLLSILEGTHTAFIPKHMISNLDLDVIKLNLEASWTRAQSYLQRHEDTKDVLSGGFRCFILLSVLQEYDAVGRVSKMLQSFPKKGIAKIG